MHFHYPHVFFTWIAFAFLLAIYAWSNWSRRRDLQRLGEWKYLRDLIPVDALIRRKKKDIVALTALGFLLFSAAGPQFGARLTEVKQRGVDVFIALDTSRSMLAEDVAPSRLERAKQALGLLTSKLAGHRVGIIAFAKYAVVQCPLTTDAEAAQMFLDILDENSVPEQGTAIGDAIRLGLKNMDSETKSGKAIVLLTDGEDHRSDPIGAANEAKDKGVVVFTIGIGTSQGEVIKKKDENGKVLEFLKHNGEMVLSRLDDGLLTKISDITGGQYYRASSTDREIDDIAEIINGYEKNEFATKMFERYEERYQYFLIIALLLLIIEFFFAEKTGQGQRLIHFVKPITARWFPVILLAFFSVGTIHAELREHVLSGNKKFKKGDFSGARAEFESARIDAPDDATLPYNIAACYLLEGNFSEARRAYDQANLMTNNPTLKAHIAYNMGHLAFYEGKRDEAIGFFKEAVKLNPKDMDAKYNIEYIRAGKSPKQPPPQQQKKNRDDSSNDKQNQDGSKSESKDQDGNEKKNEQQKQSEAKENAERVLQMMQDQEKEKLKKARLVPMDKSKGNQKEESTGEDW